MESNNSKKHFLRNKYLNYGYIFSLTLLALIFIVNIFTGSFEKFTANLKISPNSVKVVLVGIIIVTYISLVTPSVRVLAENKVLTKTSPRGERGPRGNRGSVGSNAACKECGDDLCFKKMLFNITQTINFWRQQNGMELLNENYTIDNEYIRDKIKKHCKSKTFKKLLTKFGANNKKTISVDPNVPICPEEIRVLGENGCGAYDFLFKMWSIWILHILRYKNGMLFLESPGLKEGDFPGLIEMEDGFQVGNVVKYDNDQTQFYSIFDNSEFPFFKIKRARDNKIVTEVYINKLSEPDYRSANIPSTAIPLNSWDDMFSGSKEDSIKNKIIKVKKVHLDITNNQYSLDGISTEFVKKIGNVPSGGKLSPFDEIKRYEAWLWGSDPASRPIIVIDKEQQNLVCDSCFNSNLCSKNNISAGIKVKFTNSYKKLVDLTQFSNSNDEYIKPFSQLYVSDFNNPIVSTSLTTSAISGDAATSSDSANANNQALPFSIFRAQSYIDTLEPHPFFKTYRPVGDIILNNDNFDEIINASNEDREKCRPDEGGYDGELSNMIKGIGSKNQIPNDDIPFNYRTNNHIYTLLVSGDTKPPRDFILKKKYNKQTGINKNLEGITIWEPIPEDGYAALGYVIDIKTFDTSLEDTQIPKPPRDVIATVPKQILKDLMVNKSSDLFFDYKITNINTFGSDNLFNVQDIEFQGESASTTENYNFSSPTVTEQTYSGILCEKKAEIIEQIANTNMPSTDEVINKQFIEKKYSIQKIFDNYNE